MAQQIYKGHLESLDKNSYPRRGGVGSVEPNKDTQMRQQRAWEGLVGYWPFNGNANDESGTGNDGTVIGATLTTDRFGNPNSAYFFDGEDDHINCGDSEALRMYDAVTMMAWINPDFFHTSINGIVVNREGEYEFARRYTNEIYYAIYNTEPGWYWISTGYQVSHNEWNHIAVVYDAGLTIVYVNAEPIFGYSGSGTILDAYPSYNELRIGGRQSSESGPFRGIIDDVRIYNRALSAEEVFGLYNETPPDLLAQFGTCYAATGLNEDTYPGYLLTIDALTGAGTLIGQTGIFGDVGSSVPALAIRSTGEMYALSAASSSDLYLINASTGAASFVANTGLSSPDALAFDASDSLYVVANNNNLYTLDRVTGIATLIGPTGFVTKALAYDPTDGTMYGCSPTDEIYTVDLTTGYSTLVGTTGLGGSTHAIHFDQEGGLYGTKGSALIPYTLIAIDKVTGAGTTIGPIGFSAVISLAARVISTPVTPVTVDLEIDPSHQFVPAEGDTFAYALTFTNHTSQLQVIDWWTKVIRPIGNDIDPLSGPELRVLARFETLVIDTPSLPVPFDAVAGDYQLVVYFGRYLADTLGTDTSAFSKLPGILCEDISRFQSRCRSGGLVQARAILNDTSHTGETLEISVDQFPYLVTIGSNGQAVFSQTGFNPGVHTVELTNPTGCYPASTIFCSPGMGKDDGDPWESNASQEIPARTALLENYPDPFNPSTTIRYTLSEDSHVVIEVYNMLGQLTKTLLNASQPAGNKEVAWDGSNDFGRKVASGIYIYKMTVGRFVEMKRMMLLK
jgi:hypothetical protein